LCKKRNSKECDSTINKQYKKKKPFFLTITCIYFTRKKVEREKEKLERRLRERKKKKDRK